MIWWFIFAPCGRVRARVRVTRVMLLMSCICLRPTALLELLYCHCAVMVPK